MDLTALGGGTTLYAADSVVELLLGCGGGALVFSLIYALFRAQQASPRTLRNIVHPAIPAGAFIGAVGIGGALLANSFPHPAAPDAAALRAATRIAILTSPELRNDMSAKGRIIAHQESCTVKQQGDRMICFVPVESHWHGVGGALSRLRLAFQFENGRWVYMRS